MVTTAAEIGGKMMEGYVLASFRKPGEGVGHPLRFKLVARPTEARPGGILHGQPGEIEVSDHAGTDLIKGRVPGFPVWYMSMWRVGEKLGWADLGLPPGCDYWLPQ